MAPSLEPRVHVGPDGGAVIRGFAQPRSAIDQKSVYVGNLPEGTTRSELEHVFGEFGRIVQVNVIKKHYGKPLRTRLLLSKIPCSFQLTYDLR